MTLLSWLLAATFVLMGGGYGETGKILPPYFLYSSAERDALAEQTSSQKITLGQIKKWDALIEALPFGTDSHRLKAYLFTAQRDAAFLSAHAHEEPLGNLDAVAYGVVKLFSDKVEKPPESDVYSQLLAEIVLRKIRERFLEEQEHLRDDPVERADPKLKEFARPYAGLMVASWKPWILKHPKQFLVPAPPPSNDPVWKVQAELVQKSLSEATEEEKEKVAFWSKNEDWSALALEYMEAHDTPLMKLLLVRSVLAQADSDTLIPTYYTKYTYLVARPVSASKAHDPSYPSGHATLGAMSAVLMTHFFPADEEHWYDLAKEEALSRVWGGVHYPLDTWEGRKLGLKLGNEILFALRGKCI